MAAGPGQAHFAGSGRQALPLAGHRGRYDPGRAYQCICGTFTAFVPFVCRPGKGEIASLQVDVDRVLRPRFFHNPGPICKSLAAQIANWSTGRTRARRLAGEALQGKWRALEMPWPVEFCLPLGPRSRASTTRQSSC